MDTQTTATTTLNLTDNLRRAIDHAFEEARASLAEDGGLIPFSIICTSDGFDVADHPGDSSDDVYESVKTMLAREMPESYAFIYDGYVDTDEGRQDAVICEAAKRGDERAYLLALPYAQGVDGYVFAPAYLSAGDAAQLYPRGTRPIVSGLVALAAERERAAEQQDGADEGAAAEGAAAPAHH